MILRTPQKRKVEEAGAIFDDRPVSERPLVIYEDPVPVSSHDPTSTSDHMLCTYQCRQMVKAEFFDALESAEKQVHDYQSRLDAMKENLCKTEAEKKKFKDQFRFAEQELAATKGREQALQEQLLKEVNDSQERYQTVLKRVSELEVQLKKELDLRRKAECSAAAAEDNAKELEEKLRRVSESAERERNRLHKELLHVENDSKLSVSRINANLERMACRANNAERESELLKTQLEDLREQLHESLRQKNEVECKLSTLTIPSGVGGSSETDILVKHLQQELRNLEAEVRDARKWKSSYGSSELLKEKLLEEERHRERAEKELSETQVVLQNMNNLEEELISWRSLLKEIPGVSSCDDIPRKFASLQKEVIDSMMKLGDVNARLKQLEVTLEAAELAKQHAEAEAVLAKGKAEESLIEVKRLELMLSLANEERERLRKDVIEWKKGGELECGKTNESLFKELESSLAEKECSIRELERNLHEQREVITGQHGELKLLNEKLNNEARRIKSLEREGDRLRSEISLLESKLGHGDYSAANTKVLRMVNTLAFDNEAKHTIEALQAELQKTKAKLQAIEDLKGQSGAGNIVDSQIPEKLAQLKAQIATLEKREERYKTVFAEKISVFRRACCSLFGYKIVMDDQQRPNGIPVTRFTLQSIYAQSDDEKLEFEYESGNTNILANEYTSQPEISQQVEIFIQKMNSIPAFTANLTVESFNKQTLS